MLTNIAWKKKKLLKYLWWITPKSESSRCDSLMFSTRTVRHFVLASPLLPGVIAPPSPQLCLISFLCLHLFFCLVRKVETNQRAEKSGRGEDNSFTRNHISLTFFRSRKMNLHADSVFINAFPFSTSPRRLSSLDCPSIS